MSGQARAQRAGPARPVGAHAAPNRTATRPRRRSRAPQPAAPRPRARPRVTASRDLIEDACQFAWLKLLDSHPERSSLFGWLYVVALHEAYRHLRIERRALHSSAVGRMSLQTSKIVA